MTTCTASNHTHTLERADQQCPQPLSCQTRNTQLDGLELHSELFGSMGSCDDAVCDAMRRAPTGAAPYHTTSTQQERSSSTSHHVPHAMIKLVGGHCNCWCGRSRKVGSPLHIPHHASPHHPLRPLPDLRRSAAEQRIRVLLLGQQCGAEVLQCAVPDLPAHPLGPQLGHKVVQVVGTPGAGA
jgi:hypothetical protein